MKKSIAIKHAIADVTIRPKKKIAGLVVGEFRQILDQLNEEYEDADLIQKDIKKEHGSYYRTPGYILWLYRHRANLSQLALALKANVTQGDISKMEKNKRPMGKTVAKRLAVILRIDYRKLL